MSIFLEGVESIKTRAGRRVSLPRRVRRPPKPLTRPVPVSNPRESWPAWTDSFRLETNEAPTSDLDLSAFVLASPDEAEPTPRSVAWNDGYGHGYAMEEAAPPAEMANDVALSWWAGYDSGRFRRQVADDARIDGLEDRACEPSHAELVEAVGVHAARYA